ncbi:MAG: hypothetical protein ACOC3V_00035 [bacterium]
MPWYRVEAYGPIEYYEAEDETSARNKYAENFDINYRYCIVEREEMPDIPQSNGDKEEITE